MRIQDFAHKNVCILGFGREGKATADALLEYAKGCSIVIADKNPETRVENGPSFAKATGGKKWTMDNIEFQTGPHYLDNLERFDVVIKSPGIPPQELSTVHFPLSTSPTQIFFDSIKDTGAIIVGVTGSKGKSTTSTLIHAILKAAGKDSHLVGNIGEPAIAHLKEARLNTIFVHELSSYQLMDLVSSPEIAVVTAFFPEHLDYHGSLDAYLEAKKHITRFQTEKDTVIFNATSPEAKLIASEGEGKKIGFSTKDSPVKSDDIFLKGEHNLGNIAAAWLVCELLGVEKETAVQAITTFRGLPHRLESIGVVGGIEWVNDSISTTPESAVAALKAFDKRVSVIILGGQDRGYDFAPLAEKIKNSPWIRMAILLPDSGTVIGKAIEHAGAAVILSNAETLDEAVATARKAALDPKPEVGVTPVVILSPAAPSYGHYKNFEERGELFRKAVK